MLAQGRSGLACSVRPEAEAARLARAGRRGPVAGQRPSQAAGWRVVAEARCDGMDSPERAPVVRLGVRNSSKGRGGLGEEREKGLGRGGSPDVGRGRVRRSGRARQRRSNRVDDEKPSRWLGELHGVPLRLGNLEAKRGKRLTGEVAALAPRARPRRQWR
jgi:hypothetical protein